MWLKIFLTPSTGIPNSDNFVQGLYRPNDVTPYMHVLVFHIHEFIEKHKKWGLKSFSCAPVENKNHQQVTQFFRKTLRDGANFSKFKKIREFWCLETNEKSARVQDFR
ncbi:hypothetical protein GLOIN_2v1847745 [Rhizophagus irregularis DAOM 181602=DAOM 197198]|uniref:Uncharacterized protein n=1 Tax=Rhizophagus irregularis (strain DAOM 181602 / DAOM 197198 / MUCL 43194) TaxID=747089 RepID=A0A2P4P439_RHIID|nr:hypothetical protein GLOIN_2v1847745 [Rhizophagus irregularis DAOM 181602=DAOM 197198]POG60145.1 hypothetical protein GLOIN_2v1847745 [Rhizophagus irregularis DAOM 181602=DAOM 197198]|eukprot:XP_025167011.1 hypothetical protein GLOIN_2v1847745 [Rhizophagus irregularis DAOM 181602=DAOM 197198]